MRSWRPMHWLILYSIAMAYVESAVVVYLRAIYYPHGFAFPLAPMAGDLVAIEIGREAATLVMLLGVAGLAGRTRWTRFLAFCVGFGVWDLCYYVWLWVLLRWPSSLFTWDILFLIPVPWVGPVLAPVIVSILLVIGGLWLWRREERALPFDFPGACRLLLVAGMLLVLASFTLDFRIVVAQHAPAGFRWGLFGAGVATGIAALLLAARKQSS